MKARKQRPNSVLKALQRARVGIKMRLHMRPSRIAARMAMENQRITQKVRDEKKRAIRHDLIGNKLAAESDELRELNPREDQWLQGLATMEFETGHAIRSGIRAWENDKNEQQKEINQKVIWDKTFDRLKLNRSQKIKIRRLIYSLEAKMEEWKKQKKDTINPWALLSGIITNEEYHHQVRRAMNQNSDISFALAWAEKITNAIGAKKALLLSRTQIEIALKLYFLTKKKSRLLKRKMDWRTRIDTGINHFRKLRKIKDEE